MEDLNIAHSSSEISRWTYQFLVKLGIPQSWASYVNLLILLVIVVILVYVVQAIARRILYIVFAKLEKSSHITFFSALSANRFPHFLALILPFSLVKNAIPIVFAHFPAWINPLEAMADVYLVFMVIWMLMALIRSGADVLREKPGFQDKPLDSYMQVIRLVFFLIGAVVIFSNLTGKSPTAFFAAMGAASAVLLLMFKDTIMGFVASIQVTSNDMVRIGDWITMPKYGADGDVIEINLTTVKVQNFDKTITTIPTYSLISDSFQNWRGMQASGGRRIKRSLIIRQSSIRYINDEELDRFRKIQALTSYIDERQAEIAQHNKTIKADRSIPVNGRNLTNAGLFRKYIDWYLKNHPDTHKGMTMMVRQLAPVQTGLPLELYVFTNTVNWIKYEYIMADIFDHLIAAVRYFDLQVFEFVTGSDVYDMKAESILSTELSAAKYQG